MTIDLTAVVTFHREGILAHTALRSYLRSCRLAQDAAIAMNMVLVLDNCDEETRRMVRHHPDLHGDEIIIEASLGDAALARNLGISHATGTYVCTLDGDDLISREYFQRHFQSARQAGHRAVLHAEIVAIFGRDHRFSHQIDQRAMPFSEDMLLSENPWVSAVFGRREIFSEVPYVACYPSQTGFGYEDWHWSCQTTAAGLEHVVVPGTAYFYRLKSSGSVNATSSALQVLMPPSDLFGRWEAS